MSEKYDPEHDSDSERRRGNSAQREAAKMREQVVWYLQTGSVATKLREILSELLRSSLREVVREGLQDASLREEIKSGIAREILTDLSAELHAARAQVLNDAEKVLFREWRTRAGEVLKQGLDEAVQQQGAAWRKSLDARVSSDLGTELQRQLAQWQQQAGSVVHDAIDKAFRAWTRTASGTLRAEVEAEVERRLSQIDVNQLVGEALANREVAVGREAPPGGEPAAHDEPAIQDERARRPAGAKRGAGGGAVRRRRLRAAWPWVQRIAGLVGIAALLAWMYWMLMGKEPGDRGSMPAAPRSAPAPAPSTPPATAIAAAPGAESESKQQAGLDSLRQTWDRMLARSAAPAQPIARLLQTSTRTQDYECWFDSHARAILDGLVDDPKPTKLRQILRQAFARSCVEAYALHGVAPNRAVYGAQAAARELLGRRNACTDHPSGIAGTSASSPLDGQAGNGTHLILNAALRCSGRTELSIDKSSPVDDYLFALYTILARLHTLDANAGRN
jgi:hypothetical protein